ncbi:16684_t:CDS:2 [Entrophospora sp. SA101]|nr:16684_t:CDS:2 [Entrophospora sp. SA101]CAJ0910413.1 5282_t:CDS:2 [Entrophospora sp. SA101]
MTTTLLITFLNISLFGKTDSTEGNLKGGSSKSKPSDSSNFQYLDLESQNEEKIEGLTGKVRLLKEITLSIGESVKESNSLVGSMSDQYSNTRNYLSGTMDKLKILSISQDSLRLAIKLKSAVDLKELEGHTSEEKQIKKSRNLQLQKKQEIEKVLADDVLKFLIST